jgi:hypothetical protein
MGRGDRFVPRRVQMAGSMAVWQIDLAGHETAQLFTRHERPRADVDELDKTERMPPINSRLRECARLLNLVEGE